MYRRGVSRAILLLALFGCGGEAQPAGGETPAEATEPAPPSMVPSPAPTMETRTHAEPPTMEAAPAATPPPAPEPPPPPPLASAPRAGETREVPAGVVLAGTRPGLPGRSPLTEADLVRVEVPAFSIDRLPFPNDPAQPPLRGVGRAEAARQCEAAGKRLCHELEWERACEGDAGERPLHASYDLDDCRDDPRRCAAPFDVLSLGFGAAEWTASDDARRPAEATLAVYRGARADAELARHRCGARGAATLDTSSPHIGFRCCSGPAPELTYPTEPNRARFRDVEASEEAIRTIFASIPELAPYAASFRPLDEERARSALRRAGVDDSALHGWELVTGVLRWAPVNGEYAWVISGTTAAGALLTVIHPLDDGSFVHAASFLLEGESDPISVAFTPPERKELQWYSIWGGSGEGGVVQFRDEDQRIVIVHR